MLSLDKYQIKDISYSLSYLLLFSVSLEGFSSQIANHALSDIFLVRLLLTQF